MKDKEIKQVILDKTAKLSVLAERVSSDFDDEAVHDLRTTAKSLRAFLHLLSMHTGKKLTLPGKFKRLYSIAGAYRDAQLELAGIEEKKLHLPRYTKHLRKVVLLQQQEWAEHYDAAVIKQLEDKLLGHHFGEMHPVALENFFDARFGSVKEISQVVSPTEAQVHQARKDLKDITYTAKIAHKKWDGAGDVLSQLPLERIEDVTDAIGNYHDRRMDLDRLCAFTARAADDDEQRTIQSLCGEESSWLIEEKQRVLDAVRDLVSTREAA